MDANDTNRSVFLALMVSCSAGAAFGNFIPEYKGTVLDPGPPPQLVEIWNLKLVDKDHIVIPDPLCLSCPYVELVDFAFDPLFTNNLWQFDQRLFNPDIQVDPVFDNPNVMNLVFFLNAPVGQAFPDGTVFDDFVLPDGGMRFQNFIGRGLDSSTGQLVYQTGSVFVPAPGAAALCGATALLAMRRRRA